MPCSCLNVYNLSVLDALWKILSVAAGGAAGAVARYLINISPLSAVFEKFPLPTFVINVSGLFLIGFLLIFLTDKWDVGDNLRMAVIVGFLGAFTTFSTFSLDIAVLWERGAVALCALYVALSLAVSVGTLFFGLWLMRQCA